MGHHLQFGPQTGISCRTRVNSILAAGLDRQQVPAEPAQAALPLHDNVRGPDYYH